MSFLESNVELRRDPRKLLPGARSVIAVGMNYYLGDKLRSSEWGVTPRIAQYARLRDYHRFLRRLGEDLADWISEALAPESISNRVLVDTAPILERSIAARAGGGFIGKNTCFIHPKLGSWILLAEILTTADLSFESPHNVVPSTRSEHGGCGSCRRCQVYCPTGALNLDYVLDANRCLAYWTIEHRGVIPEEFWPWLGKYYFGCDICQLVCPYNRGAKILENQNLVHFKQPPSLFDIATMDQSGYERMFGGTPMTRAKRHGLKRNALIAMAVTDHPQLFSAMKLAPQGEAESVVSDTVNQIVLWLQSKMNETSQP